MENCYTLAMSILCIVFIGGLYIWGSVQFIRDRMGLSAWNISGQDIFSLPQ
jgi:hypothetical protein